MTIPDDEATAATPYKPRELVFVGLVVLFLAMSIFWRVLAHAETLAFRDAGHFYYPFYRSVQTHWQSGLPLWNELEQLGRPLLADPTAAVFYPGKLIFALPIEFDSAYNLFIIVHVLWAAITSFITARGFGCSVLASGFCAIGYAFAGPIVFQYCNAVFLIGASWFPLTIGFSYRLTAQPKFRDFLGLSIVFSNLILGGDVQAIYHAMLVQFVLVFLLKADSWWMRIRQLILPFFAILLSVGWTAGQFLPSMQWAANSNRAASESPRNIYEWAVHQTSREKSSTDAWSAFWTKPEIGSHRDKTYQFSVGPWRWAEMIWPNFSGRQLPENRRWLNAIPAEQRVWAPTLYGGILVVLFAVHAAGQRIEIRWLRWLVVLSALSSLGGYGLGWLANEVLFLLGKESLFWGPVGGVHWLMNLVLPFFNLFRYPAKIWTVLALACSLLAAIGLDQMISGFRPLAKTTKRLFVLTSCCLIASFAIKPLLFEWWRDAPVDQLLGPLDRQGAFDDLTRSFLHCLMVLGSFGLIWKFLQPKTHFFFFAIVLLSAVDIYSANRWTILSAESATWKRESPIAAAIRAHADATHRQSLRTIRIAHSGWYPNHWSEAGDPKRIRQCVNWDRQTLKPKYGLLEGIQLVNGLGSFSDARVERRLLRSNMRLPSPAALDELSIRYVIAPVDQLSSRSDLSSIFQYLVEEQEIGVGFNQDAMPDAWIAVQDGASCKQQVEAEKCQVIRKSASEVVVIARLDSAATLVLNDLFVDGWDCQIKDLRTGQIANDCEVFPVNELFRGVAIDTKGDYEVVFRYVPAVVYTGFAISIFSMAATILIVVLKCRRA